MVVQIRLYSEQGDWNVGFLGLAVWRRVGVSHFIATVNWEQGFLVSECPNHVNFNFIGVMALPRCYFHVMAMWVA